MEKKFDLKQGDEVLIRGKITGVCDEEYVLKIGPNYERCIHKSNLFPAIENDWVDCNVKKPERADDVLVQLKITDNGATNYVCRIGHYTNKLNTWGIMSGTGMDYIGASPDSHVEVVYWKPLPALKYVDVFENAGYSDRVCELARNIRDKYDFCEDGLLELLEGIVG